MSSAEVALSTGITAAVAFVAGGRWGQFPAEFVQSAFLLHFPGVCAEITKLQLRRDLLSLFLRLFLILSLNE